MQRRIRGVTVHAAEHGSGTPLVALHGAGVDHREIEAAVEAVLPDPGRGLRRVYPDLPGMGRSTAEGLSSNDDVVAVIGDLVEEIGPVLLLGHSYGAYLARGVAARRPDALLGLALFCPAAEHSHDVPAHEVVREDAGAHDELAPGQRPGFDEYFVVRTPATARRYRDHVVPGTALADEAALGRIFASWRVDVGDGTFTGPTLIVAGRQDSAVGSADAVALLARYPRATAAVVDGAGHALLHERPELVGALLRDWLDRAG